MERCFDLQLLNELSGSRLKPQMEAYISMLEEENKLANLHLSRLTQPPPAQQPSPKDCHSQLQTVQAQLVAVQAQLQSAQCALSERESTLRQKTTAIEHLHRFFEDCREVLISTLVELGSLQRGSADAGGIERCLQRGEQAVSVLGEIVRGKGRFEENAVLEELAQQVKYY